MSRSLKFAVLGSPVSHSLSPKLHAAAYKHLGLDFEYSAIEIAENNFEAFMDSLDSTWRGFSVTMPLKRLAYEYAGERDELATKLGVANTLYLANDDRKSGGSQSQMRSWRASNTDVVGILEALRSVKAERAIVLGSGATAKNCVYALSVLGISQVTVAARNQAAAIEIVREFNSPDVSARSIQLSDISESADYDLVINTVPGDPEPLLSPTGVLFEVSYNPWPTKLAAAWLESGRRVIPGIDMLIHQAVAQVAIFAAENTDKWEEKHIPEITEVMAKVVNRDFGSDWVKAF